MFLIAIEKFLSNFMMHSILLILDFDCVFHEASHNLNSLETIVEETSDDLRSDLSEDDAPLSECHNSINSWIDSELENESNSSSKESKFKLTSFLI